MDRSEWLTVIGIVVGVILALPNLLLQWLTYRASHRSDIQPTRRTPRNIEFQWKVATWIIRLVTFAAQTASIYFVVIEYSNNEPPTRQTTIFISSMIGVFVICFVIPVILNVYASIENLTSGD